MQLQVKKLFLVGNFVHKMAAIRLGLNMWCAGVWRIFMSNQILNSHLRETSNRQLSIDRWIILDRIYCLLKKPWAIFPTSDYLHQHLICGVYKQLHSHKTLVCNYPSMPNFNGGLLKSTLKSEHGWVDTSYIKQWLQLLIHAPIWAKLY